MLDASEKYRLNETPRISANQLAEYTLASPTRRQTIIRNAKFAPTFLVIRYSEAREIVCDFLSDGTRPVSRLHQGEADLKKQASISETDFKINDALMSAEAVHSFASFAGDPKQIPTGFSKLTFVRPSENLPKIEISEVSVSVQIDLISRNIAKEKCGGVVLQTSKTVASKSWREEHASAVAVLVWMSLEKNLKGYGDVDRSLCYSLDLFAKKARQAPASYKRRVKDIEAACQEIAMLWDVVQPPADYE